MSPCESIVDEKESGESSHERMYIQERQAGLKHTLVFHFRVDKHQMETKIYC